MNDAWSIMDIVILVCGVYALYAAYVLKTKGKIIKTFLVFKETDVNTCKDLGAYAASMAPKLSTLAGVMILYGCLLYTSPSPRDVEESRMPSSA